MDWEATIEFYTEGLGFEMVYPWTFPPIIERSPFLRAPGGGYVEIFGPSDAAAGAPLETTRTEPFGGEVEPPVAHIALEAASRENVDRVVARAVAAGAQVHTAPEDRELQGDVNLRFRIAMLVGIDGEVIEIMHTGQLDV